MTKTITTAEAFTQGVAAGRRQVYRQMDADAAGQGYLVPDPRNPYADQPTEPARVLPSREEVREAILSAWRAGGLNGPWVWPAVDAVLAMFASTPTVEQVKAEALTVDELAATLKAHDFARMGCLDHDRGSCDPAGCHEVEVDQYQHYAEVVQSRSAAQPVPDVPEVGLPSAEVPCVGGERKVVTRPWRIERLQVGGWRCLTTVTTRDRAEQELAWYRGHRYGQLRVRNRETGEVIGGSDA